MLKNLPFKNYLYLSLGLDVATILVIFFFKSFLPPVVPLLYGNPTGTGQLIPTLGLLIAPGVSLVITIINTILSLLTKNDFQRKILMLSAFIVSILTTITVIKIFFLVGYF